jgi:beta-lactamase class A
MLTALARIVQLKAVEMAPPGPHRPLCDAHPGGIAISVRDLIRDAVAHKTGTGGTRHGLTRAANDIGIITLQNGRHLAIAVFVKDSTADEPTREATIAKIARAAYDAWSTR